MNDIRSQFNIMNDIMNDIVNDIVNDKKAHKIVLHLLQLKLWWKPT